jgi:hypothetical protein
VSIAEPPITIRAAHDSGPHTRGIWGIVIHDAEYPEGVDSGEAVARYFQRESSGGSAHYVQDPDDEEHCVPDGHMAWGVAGANNGTIHQEQDGYAKQTRAEWLDTSSRRTLCRTAARTAALCVQYQIPPAKRRTADGERRTAGIYGHVDLSRVSWVTSTHTDPGPQFPWDVFMQLLERAYAVLRSDGGIQGFQQARGLTVDGIAGRDTVRELGTWLAEPSLQEDDMPYTPDQLKAIVRDAVGEAAVSVGGKPVSLSWALAETNRGAFQTRDAVASLTAQVGALRAALGSLAGGGSLTPEQVTAAAQAGAAAALAELGRALTHD